MITFGMKQFRECRGSSNSVVNPLDYLVRSKNYTYLENISHYKNLNLVSNFFEHFENLRIRIL